MKTLPELLRGNPYPGRGIALGRTADGERFVAVYFIMGRSENSRNRIFVETQDGIKTQAFDESKMTDPSLIIYHPVRLVGKKLVVTNGDQTDTVAECLRAGHGFRHGLRQRTFEPDGPNWTPRISGLLHEDGMVELSILKTDHGDDSCCCRHFFSYDNLRPGTGRFISTYETDGTPLPSFQGEPLEAAFGKETARELADKVWAALDENNKVSLFVRTVDQKTGETDSVIINRHGEEGK
ncbi:MAG: inosine monophosphate cyclohydrolase [Oscillospiraceae bacterium]|jgi:IMP cyclohydrolase|nr:inosine monophosphate cyclohydrolase [Oscillospiraceae bacterium]